MRTGRTKSCDCGRLAAFGIALALAGCRGHERVPTRQSPPAQATAIQTASPPSPAIPVVWSNAAKHVRLNYPADWRPRNNPDYELTLLPVGASTEDRRITLDIPDLPPHLPWMIQMSRIQHDYLQDLKKLHPDLKLLDAAPVRIPNASARLVRSAWGEDAGRHDDVVLLIIHAGAVYILDAQSDHPHLADTRRVFDGIQLSLRWQ